MSTTITIKITHNYGTEETVLTFVDGVLVKEVLPQKDTPLV
ncbi:MAG: hypothetical protein QG583_236 [Patescibacteria group bacterium]|nr:hypothetical protein [Patescibacteria group bacterium]